MRQIKRWMAAMAVALLVPAVAGAATFGNREAMMEWVVSERGTMSEVHGQLGGLLHWLSGVISALWGATRGTVVPPSSGGNGLAVDLDPTAGGA